jgi:CDGSH iron-sulfur domain-containing protein 3
VTSRQIAQKAPFPVDVEAGKTYWWCACGQSKKQPFCDGSHKTTDIVPVAWTADKTGKSFFCGCKQSKTETAPTQNYERTPNLHRSRLPATPSSVEAPLPPDFYRTENLSDLTKSGEDTVSGLVSFWASIGRKSFHVKHF